MRTRALRGLDWALLAPVLALTLLGVLSIYSATRGTPQSAYYLRQLLWMAVALLGMAVLLRVDYQWLGRASWALYGLGLALLVLVLLKGREGMGAQRWLSLWGLSMQPSEFFRIAFLLALSRVLSAHPGPLKGWAFLKIALAFGALPFLLLVSQPDLGTAAVLMLLLAALMLLKGVQRRLLVALLLVAAVSAPFLAELFWNDFLKPYQRDRLVAFLRPGTDPEGIGYQLRQSKIAIGSGMCWGKGYLKGTQGFLRFLPERHTDFIFASFAEEWGLAGSVLLFALYLVLFLRGLQVARRAKDAFGRFLALGVVLMLLAYFFFNVGMSMGMMPVVGLPMPFMSYGGSALLANYLAVGLLLNVHLRRYQLFY
jgi:rod shape determining protein RodA